MREESADVRVIQIENARLRRALADLQCEYDLAHRDFGMALRRAERAEQSLAAAAAEAAFLRGLVAL